MWRSSLRTSFVFAIVFGALLVRAEAQEYCVACSEPPAVYRCVIEGAKPGGTQPLQMLCVTTIAKEGGHATCSVKGGTVFDCNGQVKRLSWAAINDQSRQGSQEASAPVAPAPPQPLTKPSEQAPPQTVLDMAKRANEQSGEQWKKAGETMKEQTKSFGDATKKTWDCVASFFTRCGG